MRSDFEESEVTNLSHKKEEVSSSENL
jgi:hypothetical protein